MEHSKLYQYENVAKVSALDYSGKLAVKTTGDNQYDVSSPVNTAENYSVNEDVIVLSNTLDNEEPMKFSFSFKVNKSAVGVGTNLLLDMPGLFSVKSENNTLWFKFYYEDAPAWKYINASELVNGWNNVALVGDGVKVTLTVNNAVHTLLDSSSVYPSLSLGILKTYQSWLNLKDIEALKIESQDSGESGGNTGGEEPLPQEPPVQASALPQGWAMWQISGGVFRYSKGLPGKDSDGYYDSYVLYTNINVDDQSQYQTEDSVVLGESEGSASKYIIQAKGTPITLIASNIKTSSDKKEE